MHSYTALYSERLYENEGFPALVNLVLPEHHRILDVGCGNGSNLYLLSQRGHEGVGLTMSEAEARIVRDRGFECIVWDATVEDLPFPAGSFDALLFCHVLEHCPLPEEVLKRYLKLVRAAGGIYIVLPNILHIIQRLQFLGGRFKYKESGVLDRTHLRFFDFNSARQLAEECGLRIVRHFGIGQCPAGPLREWVPGLCRRIDQWTTFRWPGLFAVHLVVIAQLTNK